MPRLVLASASPARLGTLRAAGIEPEVRVSGVDEQAVVSASGPLSPADMVLLLSRMKAESVVDPDALVLGCDSVLELDDEVYGKPADAASAAEHWRRMRGRPGVLRTGHWVVYGRRATGRTASTTVRFADVTDAEIDSYVATGEPLGVAGGFTVDGRGGAFVSGVEGDHHNVVGLSLPLLRQLLNELGVFWPDLWRP